MQRHFSFIPVSCSTHATLIESVYFSRWVLWVQPISSEAAPASSAVLRNVCSACSLRSVQLGFRKSPCQALRACLVHHLVDVVHCLAKITPAYTLLTSSANPSTCVADQFFLPCTCQVHSLKVCHSQLVIMIAMYLCMMTTFAFVDGFTMFWIL